MQNLDRKGNQQLENEGKRFGIRSAEDLPDATFGEVHGAFNDFIVSEALSTSRHRALEPKIQDSLKKFNEVSGRSITTPADFTGDGRLMFSRGQERLLELDKEITDLKKTHPDLLTFGDILKQAQQDAKVIRDKSSRTAANATGARRLGVLTGSMFGIAQDPIVVGSMLLGTGAISGGSMLNNAWRAFKVEAAIGAGSEALIQPTVMAWKSQLESPYSLQEAATNIALAGIGGGVLRSTGSVVMDTVQLRALAKAKRAENTAASNHEADILDDYAGIVESTPEDIDLKQHLDNIEQATQQINEGRPATVGKDRLESVDPREIQVDAETFQFKAGGDAEGVSDRLRGVDQWDSRLAGTSFVYERRNGERFIVDGHQRLALAKRAIEGGQSPDEVRMNAFVLREADGVSPDDARQIAAIKNIAEGTGTAIDAAKLFRALGTEALDVLPPLPPRSNLVSNAKALSRLSDDAFKQVVNDIVDERIGAIVGSEITNPAEQQAVIAALSRAQPANLNQARIMVRDMKAAGFTRVETEDLFGGQEFAESLFKERARVLDDSVKKLRNDKRVFSTLERESGQILEEGNQLNRAANQQRAATDTELLDMLTRSANNKGPVSDALNEAASRLRAGEKPGQVVDDFVRSVRSTTDEQDIVVDLPELQPVLKDNDPRLVDTQQKYTDASGNYSAARTKLHNQIIDTELEKGLVAPDGEAPTVILMGGGGGSGKGTVLAALQSDGQLPKKGIVHIDPDQIKAQLPEYKALLKEKDFRSSHAVHEESSDISTLLIDKAKSERRHMIIDKTLGNEAKTVALIGSLKEAGYNVRLVGVTVDINEAFRRAMSRFEATGRIPHKASMVNSHRGFNGSFAKYAELVDDAVLFDSGAETKMIASAKKGSLEVIDSVAYNKSINRGKANVQERQPIQETAARQAQGEAGRGEAGAQGAAREGAGQGDRGNAPIRLVDGLFDGEDHVTPDLIEAVRAQDLDIPTGIRLDENGDEILETIKARDLFDEIDNQGKHLDELETCYSGGISGKAA